MEHLLIMGAGEILFAFEEDGVKGAEWVPFPIIVVTVFGVVMYREPAGEWHTSTSVIDTRITEVEWTCADALTDLAAAKGKSANPCERCNDEDAKVAQMSPPICPKCYRGRALRKGVH